MSISLSLFKWGLKAAGVKAKYDRPAEDINRMKEKIDKNRTFTLKPMKGQRVEYKEILGRQILIIRNEKTTQRALLYFYGGGFTSEISGIEKKAAVKFGYRSGRDVWIPRYPSCNDVSVREIYHVALETYREMLKSYRAEAIAVIGFSAGADIALGMFEYNNTLDEPLPAAKIMIVSSPACEPISEEEKARIRELSDKDIMISASFMDTVIPTMCHGEELPGYMTQFSTGDLSHMPYTHIYYGSNEVLSAAADRLSDAFRRDGSQCELHIGEGLFHCYPAIDLFPETRAAFNEIVGYLS